MARRNGYDNLGILHRLSASSKREAIFFQRRLATSSLLKRGQLCALPGDYGNLLVSLPNPASGLPIGWLRSDLRLWLQLRRTLPGFPLQQQSPRSIACLSAFQALRMSVLAQKLQDQVLLLSPFSASGGCRLRSTI